VSEVSPNVVANLLFNGGLFAVLLWFSMYRLWPWWTQQYLPAKWTREDKRIEATEMVLRAVVETLTELRQTQARTESKVSSVQEILVAAMAERTKQHDTLMTLLTMEMDKRKDFLKRQSNEMPEVKPSP